MSKLFLDSSIIEEHTLLVLGSICADEMMKAFTLVDGTALALQLGHRYSIDLDLFAIKSFETDTIQDHLTAEYDFQTSALEKNTLLGSIDGIKVDIITHAYPLIGEVQYIDGVRLASLSDIAAMKLNAIAHSGTRYKDFWIYFFYWKNIH